MVLLNLIHPDQTGLVKTRYIGENLRLISDVLDFTKEQKNPGILVALDFREAFDSFQMVLYYENFGCSHGIEDLSFGALSPNFAQVPESLASFKNTIRKLRADLEAFSFNKKTVVFNQKSNNFIYF